MSEKKTGLVLRLEFIVIAIFFIGFLLWSVSRCNSTRSYYAQQEMEEQRADSIMRAVNETAILEKARKDSIANAKKQEQAEDLQTERTRYTTLYTTVEKVNVRREPKLNAKVVSRLELHEEVSFLGEVTDFKQEITIEGEQKNEPWVKVKTQAGRIGWVYGGTVSYYKK